MPPQSTTDLPLAGDEYIDPADGLIHTVRNAAATARPSFPVLENPAISCSAVSALVRPRAERQRKEAGEQRNRMASIKHRRAQGLQDRYLYDYTFANNNGQNPLMKKACAYVEHWDEVYRENTGLLLFGNVGTGKAFFVGCIANALLDRDIPVLMTNFPVILNRLTGMFSEDGQILSQVWECMTC